MSDKKIHIDYIPEEIKKSPIMLQIGNTLTIESKKEIEDIRNSIIGILDCTNLKDNFNQNSGRNIYILNENITKHLLSTISKDLPEDERRNILKIQIKNIIKEKYNVNSDIIIFIKNNKIYVLDIGKKLIEDEQYDIKNKRFDGHTKEEIEALIKTKLGENFNPREFITDILNEIDLNKLNIKQALNYLTSDYKIDLINKINIKLKTEFQIEDFLIKGISGKILRDNFFIAKNHITKLFFENFFIKNIEKQNIINLDEIYLKIINNFLNIETLEIEKIINFNLQNIYQIFIDFTSKEIGRFFSSIYTGYKLDYEQEKIFLIEFLKYQKIKKEDIIKDIINIFIENIFNIIGDNNSKNKTKLVYIFRAIDSKNIDIRINKLEGYYTMIDISNKIKQLLQSKKILESDNNKKLNELENIKNLKENNHNFLNSLINKLEQNKQEIKKLINKKISIDNITIKKIYGEISKIQNEIRINKFELNKIKNNELKKIISGKKIEQLEKNIKKLEKKLEKAQKIYELITENDKLKEKIEQIEKNLNRITKLEKQIEDNNKKIEEINVILNNIKIFLSNVFIKYFIK